MKRSPTKEQPTVTQEESSDPKEIEEAESFLEEAQQKQKKRRLNVSTSKVFNPIANYTDKQKLT